MREVPPHEAVIGAASGPRTRERDAPGAGLHVAGVLAPVRRRLADGEPPRPMGVAASDAHARPRWLLAAPVSIHALTGLRMKRLVETAPMDHENYAGRRSDDDG